MQELEEYLSIILEIMGQIVKRYGPLGIAAAMFTESLGVPFASTVVLVSAGGLIHSGKISFWTIFAANVAGITLGSIAGYLVGYISRTMGSILKFTFQGRQNSRRLSVDNGKSRMNRFIERYGNFSILLAQLFGVTRTFISIPAGIIKMNFPLFVIYTALGGALFSLASIGLSMVLTGFVRVIYRYICLFMTWPAWIWLIPVFLVALVIWLCRRLELKLPLNRFIAQGKSWLKLKL